MLFVPFNLNCVKLPVLTSDSVSQRTLHLLIQHYFIYKGGAANSPLAILFSHASVNSQHLLLVVSISVLCWWDARSTHVNV